MYSLQNFLAPKREIIWVVPTEVMECGEIRNFAGKKVQLYGSPTIPNVGSESASESQ